LKVWKATHKGKVRERNEDACYAERIQVNTSDMVLAVVCDGMGGAKSGNIASNLALNRFVQVVKTEISNYVVPTLDEQLLSNAIGAACDAVISRALYDPECSGMGTTLVAALVKSDGDALIVNIGDSRCYHYSRKNENIRQVTTDHSLVEELIAAGKVRREEARTHPQRNLITRVITSDANNTPDFFRLKLESGDFLLLCSDGLSNEADSRELAFELSYGGDVETAAQRCLNLALERQGLDNITVALIQV